MMFLTDCIAVSVRSIYLELIAPLVCSLFMCIVALLLLHACTYLFVLFRRGALVVKLLLCDYEVMGSSPRTQPLSEM
jgi:hypothetical protein